MGLAHPGVESCPLSLTAPGWSPGSSSAGKGGGWELGGLELRGWELGDRELGGWEQGDRELGG